MRYFPPAVCLFLVLLSGCAQNQMKVEQAAVQLQSGNLGSAMIELETFQPSARDVPYHLMNLALLKFAAGDYQGSIDALQTAKAQIQEFETSSVSENLQAASVNETLRSYVGTPSERVMIHFYLALSYLGLGQFDGARVEILQANVLLKEPAYEDSLSGELASAHMLSAMVFEMNQEFSNARISYAKALSIMRERKQAIPDALKLGLLSMSAKLGLTKEYEAYKAEFGLPDDYLKQGESTLFLIYANGLASPKKQKKVSVFSPTLEQIISLALPAYDPLTSADIPPRVIAKLDDSNVNFELIEDINLLLREDLSQEIGTLTAMTLARAVVKYQATKEIQAQSGALGLLSTVATHLSEIADLRNWRMLPAQILIARIALNNKEDETSNESRIQFNQRAPISIEKSQSGYWLLMSQDYSDKFILFKK